MEYAAFPLETKALSPAGEIEGLAAAFGNLDSYRDRIMPGAFAKTLKGRLHPLPMLFSHDMSRPVGAWTSLAETEAGLVAKGKITLDAVDGKSAYALVRDGAITGLSIGFITKATQPSKNSERWIKEIELLEVSLVAIPANDAARITSVKSITGPRDIQDMLRQRFSISSRKAKAAAAAAWRAMGEAADETAAVRIMNRLDAAIKTLKTGE